MTIFKLITLSVNRARGSTFARQFVPAFVNEILKNLEKQITFLKLRRALKINRPPGQTVYGFQNLCPDDNKGANDSRLIPLISRTLNTQYILLDKKRQNEKNCDICDILEDGKWKLKKTTLKRIGNSVQRDAAYSWRHAKGAY